MHGLFEQYAEWKIAKYMMDNPTKSFYVRELSRALFMSPSCVSAALHAMERGGILKAEKAANSLFYSLSGAPIAFALKRFYALEKIQNAGLIEKLLKADENPVSLALYGSYASGEYDEKSDIDILCITDKKEKDFEAAAMELEKALKIEVNVKAVTAGQWRRLAEEGSNFYLAVTRNNIILCGSSLAVK